MPIACPIIALAFPCQLNKTYKEELVYKVFTKYKLLYPIPITGANESPLNGLPWLKPGDSLRVMAVRNDLAHLLGGFSTMAEAEQMLVTFWTRYRAVFPQFQLFSEVHDGRKQLKDCIPLYIHGDEGVTYKKRGVLIMSYQSPLGFGTSRRPQEMSLNLENMGESGLPLNFLKCGMYTRILMVLCPKAVQSKYLGLGMGWAGLHCSICSTLLSKNF